MKIRFQHIDGGDVYSVDVPFSVHDIDFDSFTDFKIGEQEYLKSCQSLPNGVDPEDLTPEELEEQTKIVYNTDTSQTYLIEAIAELCTGDLDKLTFNIDSAENVNTLIEEGYVIKPQDPISTLRVYAHLITILNAYEPSKAVHQGNYAVDINGNLYEIESYQNQSLTNGEVLTLLEFERLADLRIQERGGDANIDFNLGLEQLAVLLRLKGEGLPINRKDRIKFIDNRKSIFAKLPMNVIFDIRFFLISILVRSIMTGPTSTSSKAKNQSRQQQKKGEQMR